MSELSLKIQGQHFKFWNNFSLNLVYNSLGSTFSFEGLTITPDQKRLFMPLSYHRCEVLFGTQKLLTGTLLNTGTGVENTISLNGISGYSLPGVLEDCEIPLDVYPLQFDNMSVKDIVEKLIKPFGLALVVDSSVEAEVNKKIDTIAAEPDEKIKSFFEKLCKNKNVVLTHNEHGNVVLTRIREGQSVATYIEGMPSTSIKLNVNGQGFHSAISTQKEASTGTDVAGEETINNDLIKAYRPTVKKQDSGENDDTANAAKMIRGSELRGISLTIETDRYKWTDGKTTKIIQPNNLIDVQSPSNYLPKRTRFFVESVTYTGNNEGIKASLKCVLPECYSGEAPKIVFG
jgi:prophage tail gpP-like protein